MSNLVSAVNKPNCQKLTACCFGADFVPSMLRFCRAKAGSYPLKWGRPELTGWR